MSRQTKNIAHALIDGVTGSKLSKLIREASSVELGGKNKSDKRITNPIDKIISNRVNHSVGSTDKGNDKNKASNSVNTSSITKPPKGNKSPISEVHQVKSLFDYTMYGGIRKKIDSVVNSSLVDPRHDRPIRTEDESDDLEQDISAELEEPDNYNMSDDSDYKSCLQDLIDYLVSASSASDDDLRVQVLNIVKDAVDDVSSMISSHANASEIDSSCTKWKELAYQTLHKEDNGGEGDMSSDEVDEPEMASA